MGERCQEQGWRHLENRSDERWKERALWKESEVGLWKILDRVFGIDRRAGRCKPPASPDLKTSVE